MPCKITALYRHPVKGFTPEALPSVTLTPGAAFPFDRVYAVEDGPCGFDPAKPAWIAKQKFAVLAKTAAVAKVRTLYDEHDDILRATAQGAEDFRASFEHEAGRAAFAVWLTAVLGQDGGGPYRVINGEGHRFLDHPQGHVSIVNLASVRDLGIKIGRPLSPLRFRANLYVEGWPAWAENDWEGESLSLGAAKATVFKPIVRCAATMVDPATAARDVDVPAALFERYGHVLCGIYVHVTDGGFVRQGDAAALPARS